MSRLTWDQPDSRPFHSGVDRGVFYPQNGSGVTWDGLVSVNETPSGGDVVDNHYDGAKYFSRRGPEEYEATISAFSYPLEFSEYNGDLKVVSAQGRKSFGFSYRTLLGNGEGGVTDDYQLHLVYNVTAMPSEVNYGTISDSMDPTLFAWKLSAKHEVFLGFVGSHLIIDSRVAYPEVMSKLDDILYGGEGEIAHLPTADELYDLFEEHSILKITDNGDGTWTADGSASAIQMISPTQFTITWPSAVYLSSTEYQISSL